MDRQVAIRDMRYWGMLILFSYLPVLAIHALVRLFWSKANIDNNTTVTSFETALTTIILPLYLVATHYFLSRKFEVKPNFLFIINLIIVWTCVWLSSYLHFINWANAIGDKLHPDNDTLEVIGFERGVGNLISTIGLVIVFFVLRYQRKT